MTSLLSKMGNCLLLLGLKKEKRPVTLLLVGLDNAGKTTAAKGIIGEPVDDVAPTVGFAPESLEYRGCEVTIYDLGGGKKIRPVWTKYFSEVHGVIFVVDSSDSSRVEECKEVLVKLLSDKKIAGKPILVLANKQDVEGAMDEVDVVEGLGIEEVVNRYKCPTRVETCAANTTRPSNKPDKPIADGFRWLIDTIVVHYKEINTRVEQDMETERAKQKKEMEERRERIRRLRAERERQEARRREAEMRRRQEAGEESSEGENDVVQGEEEVVVESAPSRPSVSSVPNGTLPQSHEVSGKGKRASISVTENVRVARYSPEEKQELRELGFNSQTELQESSSSSSQQVSPESTPVTPPPQPPTHKVIMVQESPSHRPATPTPASSPPAPPRPSSPLPVLPRPASPPSASLHPSSTTLNSTPPRDGDSGILDPSGYATSNGLSTPCLDLCREGRTGECVPIDSDDELFDLTSLSGDGPRETHLPSHTLDMLKVSCQKDQLELEAASTKPSKKKSFLKRYHKTAPSNPPSAPSPDGHTSVLA